MYVTFEDQKLRGQFSENLVLRISEFQLFFRIPFTFCSLAKAVLRAAGLFKCMHVTFCYNQVLKGYFYQCRLSLTRLCNLYCR